MEFRPRYDSKFVAFLAVTFLLTLGACAFAIVSEWEEEGREALPFVVPILALAIGFIAWNVLSIKYVLTMDYLYVQGGLFRSRIPYGDITRVAPTRNVWYGYRLTTAFDAIEIFYRKGLLGSVKITPRDPERFLAELKKRCPNAVFEPMR
ncbi:MAG TPA: PH domain-containing protein [Paenibacillaceae bacterium]